MSDMNKAGNRMGIDVTRLGSSLLVTPEHDAPFEVWFGGMMFSQTAARLTTTSISPKNQIPPERKCRRTVSGESVQSPSAVGVAVRVGRLSSLSLRSNHES